jgi:hypothetical protein
MPRSTLERIRQRIQQGQYDMTAHAMDEMAEDDLDIVDIECSILNGTVVRIDRHDPRGTKYVVKGIAFDETTPVGTAGRFTSLARYLIITAYKVTDLND